MAASQHRTIVCTLGPVRPDAATIDTLARLQLAAQRVGLEIRFQHVSNELQELLAFIGLGGVLRLESERQPEERKDPLRVEEERELDDPAV